MPWIESHTEIERHRKTILMAAELGIKRVYLSGHLHALWHHVLEQQEDGNLSNWPPALIAQMAEYDEGDSDRFVELLKKYCWIDAKNNLIHDWLDYAGRYLTAKYRTRNPKKLKAIYKLHESDLRLTKKRPRTDNPSGRLGRLSSSLNLNLPEWLDPTAWDAFAAMRKEVGKALTERARLRIIVKLEKLKSAGEDPNACLSQSSDHDWLNVYPVKNHNGKGKAEKQHDRTKEFFEVEL
jgi:hypothetical protein